MVQRSWLFWKFLKLEDSSKIKCSPPFRKKINVNHFWKKLYFFIWIRKKTCWQLCFEVYYVFIAQNFQILIFFLWKDLCHFLTSCGQNIHPRRRVLVFLDRKHLAQGWFRDPPSPTMLSFAVSPAKNWGNLGPPETKLK